METETSLRKIITIIMDTIAKRIKEKVDLYELLMELKIEEAGHIANLLKIEKYYNKSTNPDAEQLVDVKKKIDYVKGRIRALD